MLKICLGDVNFIEHKPKVYFYMVCAYNGDDSDDDDDHFYYYFRYSDYLRDIMGCAILIL